MTRFLDRRAAALVAVAAASLALAACKSATEPTAIPLVLRIALSSDTVSVNGSVDATIVGYNTNERGIIVRAVYTCPFGIELITAPTASVVQAVPLEVRGAPPVCGKTADLQVAAGDSVVEKVRLTPRGLVGGDVVVDPLPGRYLIGPVLVAPDGVRPGERNAVTIVVR